MNTGRLGEKWGSLIATQAGFTCNKVDEDEAGWDFRLDEDGSPSTIAHDLGFEHRTYMLQVKTTMGSGRSEPISLSNWKRMLDEPGPYFVLMLTLDESDGEPCAAALVHIGESWIERALRALRKLPPSEPLHKHHMSVSWTDEDLLPVPIWSSLRERIHEFVGAHPASYVAEKGRLRQTIGYPADGRFLATVATGLSPERPEDTERIVNFAIGLIDELPISDFLVQDVRFDEPVVVEDQHAQPMTMSYRGGPPSLGKTRLTFRDETGMHLVAMTFDTFAPHTLLPDLPPEHVKVRFASPLLSIIARPKTQAMTFQFRIPDAELVDLAELSQVGKLIELLRSPTRKKLFAAMETRGKRVELMYTDPPIGSELLPDPLADFASGAKHAGALARHYDLPPETKVKPVSIQAHHLRYRMLNSLLENSLDPTLSIEVTVDDRVPESGKRIAIVVPFMVQLGDQVLASVIAQTGTSEWDSDTQRLKAVNGPTRVLGKWAVPAKDWASFDMRKMVREASKSIEDEYDVIWTKGEDAPGDQRGESLPNDD